MDEIVIVIRDGMLEAVYADKDMLVEVIDLDADDPDEYDALSQRLTDIENDKNLKDIL